MHDVVIFIDSLVSDPSILTAGSDENTQTITLCADRPVLEQMAEALTGAGAASAVHIVAHGDAGRIVFASGALDASTLAADPQGCERVRELLSGADGLYLWSCGVGVGTVGERFVARLEEAFGLPVAAARGPVGCAGAGGTWDLDVGSAAEASRPPFAQASLAAYAHVLAVTYTIAQPFPTIPVSGRILSGDFDNDGDTDVLYQTGGNGTAFAYIRSNGDGTFTDLAIGSSPFAGISLPDYNGSNFRTGDFDGDGDLDIMGVINGSAGYFIRNDGGSFSISQPFPTYNVTRHLSGDFDNDGDTDVLYQTGSNGSAFSYVRSNGDGTFTELAIGSSPFSGLTLPDYSGNNYRTGDFDADGDLDIMAVVNNTDSQLFTNNGGTFSSSQPFPTFTVTRHFTGDFDSDGDADVLYQTGSNGSAFAYLRSNGDGTFTELAINSSPFAGLSLPDFNSTNYRAGDFDGDGDLDIMGATNGAAGYFIAQGGSPPRLTSSTPADNGTGFTASGNIVLNFDQAVTAGAGNIVIRNYATDAAVATIAANGAQVTGSGTTQITINPPSDLAASTQYYITFEIDAFANSDGQAFGTLNFESGTMAAITDKDFLNFTTGASNAAPVVTASGGTTAFVEGANVSSTPVVVDSSVTVTDTDTATLASATVAITGNFQTSEDVLAFTNDNSTMGNVSGSYVAGTGVLTLTSAGATATLAQWQAALRAVTYTNSSNTPSTSARTISFSANDGTDSSTATTKSVSVASANDAPVNTVPGSISVTEDVASALTGISFADVDAGGSSVTATLSVPSGSLAASSGGGVTVGGTASALTLTGTITAINSFIAGSNVTFTTAADATSNVTLTVAIDDGGNTGSGGAQQDSDTVTLSVTAANDAPVNTVPGSISVTEDVASALTGISFADVDAGASSVTATLSVPSGSLAATSGGGVTVGGTASALTLTGTITAINSFIAGSNVTFTTASNATSNVTLTVAIDDGGNTGTGGAQQDSDTVTLSVTAANDAPVNTVPGSISVTEDVASALTGISFADVDAGASSVTATLSVPSGSLAATSGGGVTVGGTASALTLTGTITAINSFIAGSNVTFTTAANVTSNVTLTVAIDDGGNSGSGGAQQDSDTVTLSVTAANDDPTVTGSGASQPVADTASLTPFSGIVLADVDSATITVTVTLDTAAKGSFSTLGGGTYTAGTGVYSITGSPATAQAALRALVFQPAADRVTPGQTELTSFTIAVDDGAGGTASNTAYSVLSTSQNDAPTFTNPANQAANEDGVVVFSTANGNVIRITDPDPGQTISATLQVTAGTLALSGTAGLTVTGDGTGTVTLSGSASAVNTALEGLAYTPVAGTDGVVTLSLSTTDGTSPATASTTITIAAVNDDETGSGGDDYIFGGVGDDTINAGAGNDSLSGGTGNDYVDAGDGDDGITGGDGHDTIHGGLGSDYIEGNDGIDGLFGGDGNDGLYGGTGNDSLMGGDGDDYVDGGADDDGILGGTGNDTILAGTGNDYVEGNEGVDGIFGGDGNDTIYGGDGNDSLMGEDGDDLIYGGADDDGIEGGDGNDTLKGDAGNDSINGGAGIDGIDGGDGNDTIRGGSGNDSLTGGLGNDAMYGDDDDDTLDGGSGDDYLVGGAGIDTIYGGIGGDGLFGGTGDDRLEGEDGADYLAGQDNNDTLLGGDGNDALNGGAGIDILTGGAGSDIFVFDLSALGSGVDEVTDFVLGEDAIGLSGFAALGGALVAGVNFVSGAAPPTMPVATVLYDLDGVLTYDADGTGEGGAVQIATFTGRPALTASDFLLIA